MKSSKSSNDAYTVMIFRGATAHPLQLKLRRSLVRRALMVGACLVVVQLAVLAHYAIQTSQVAELTELREELGQFRVRTVAFSEEVDELKQRMLAMKNLNRQLQTMFGLEPDEIQIGENSADGQGGEEIPYESVSADEGGAKVFGERSLAPRHADTPTKSEFHLIASIEHGLAWLDRQAAAEKHVLDQLAVTGNERVERWASTPSIWPVKGPITSRFGRRISPFTGKPALHAGVDISSPRGEEIRAPASGKVITAAVDTRMGKFIRIDHGYGIETQYGHLSKIKVKYRQKVKRGEVIGLVGNTGRFSTGPHLHYQIAVNDKVVDPLQYILD